METASDRLQILKVSGGPPNPGGHLKGGKRDFITLLSAIIRNREREFAQRHSRRIKPCMERGLGEVGDRRL